MSLYISSATIFAYGQTSSGKTYTMDGITEYSVADIFDYINKVIILLMNLPVWFFNLVIYQSDVNTRLLFLLQHEERAFVVKFSAIEIYNEIVRDLLSADSSTLRLRDDPEVNIFYFFNLIHECAHIKFSWYLPIIRKESL